MTTASELFCNRRSRFGRPDTSNYRRHLLPRPEEDEIGWHDQTSLSLSSAGTQDRLTPSSNDTRLPRAVLLARERLLQRLRGASLSRTSSHASSNVNHNDHVVEDDLRLVDAGDWVIEYTRDWGANTNHFLEQRSNRTVGLSTRALSSLLVEEFNFVNNYDQDTRKASQECSICLESFKDREQLIRLPCDHRFHYSCLIPWVRICGCCPYCRNDIVL